MVMDVLASMKERKSARAYLDKPVTRALLEEIFALAGLAPSAMNLQPWEFICTYGEEKDRLIRRLLKAYEERAVACTPGTSRPLPLKFARRSAEAGRVMEPSIAALGLTFSDFIEKGSCTFYGAPVAIIVTIDKVFPPVRYLDVGLAVSYLLLAAHVKGLATCPIGLITAYKEDIAEVLNIPSDKEILLGIALGYADETSPANAFRTGRADLKEIVRWYV